MNKMSFIFDIIDFLIVLIGKSFFYSLGIILFFNYGFVLFRRIFFKRVINTNGRAILITGCDSGFGHRLALRLNQMEFKVYATVLSSNSFGAQELIKNAVFSDKMTVLQMNITNDNEVNEVHQTVHNDLQNTGYELWAVVNNAGILKPGFAEWGTLDSNYHDQFEVNVFGAVRVTRVFLPLIRASKGRIVNVVSILGRFSLKFIGAYCMSKHAMIAFSDALRQEVKQFNVKVVTIEPAMFGTGLLALQNWFRYLDELWGQTSDEIRKTYGSIDKHKQYTTSVVNLCPIEKNINLVADDIIDSLTNCWPKAIYRPMSFISRIIYFLILFLPSTLLDRVLDLLDFFVGNK